MPRNMSKPGERCPPPRTGPWEPQGTVTRRSRGWRASPLSQDARFSFTEIRTVLSSVPSHSPKAHITRGDSRRSRPCSMDTLAWPRGL